MPREVSRSTDCAASAEHPRCGTLSRKRHSKMRDLSCRFLRARGPVLAVGFAFAAQEMAEVPIDQFDQRLDAVVTERGVTVFA